MLSFLGRDSRKSLVDVAWDKNPLFVFLYEIFVVRNLVVERIQLLVAVRGNSGIEGHAHRNVINRFCPQKRADFKYVHWALLMVFCYL